ncbi:hypothetical protein [Altererythrobacter lauratis]|uniref:DUF4282 domain-containing protein n=1 Tax=Alteraurantiacibacter lauratis TaxID=2054627 RepID=A0ABV7EF58_9SPHN
MADKDKPFVCYRQGRWAMKIMPRGGEGWRLTAMWMLSYALLSGLYVWIVAGRPDDETFVGQITAGFILVPAIWAIAMIRWMLARAEVINLDELLALKRERERDKGRR